MGYEVQNKSTKERNFENSTLRLFKKQNRLVRKNFTTMAQCLSGVGSRGVGVQLKKALVMYLWGIRVADRNRGGGGGGGVTGNMGPGEVLLLETFQGRNRSRKNAVARGGWMCIPKKKKKKKNGGNMARQKNG